MEADLAFKVVAAQKTPQSHNLFSPVIRTLAVFPLLQPHQTGFIHLKKLYVTTYYF